MKLSIIKACERAAPRLEIRLVGGLEVRHGGRPLALPRSRKTRGLLAYLVMTGRMHTREHLCDLFWDCPDDPRAALRWSLSKLRAVVGPDWLVADGDRIGFAAGSSVDLATIRVLATGSLDDRRRAGELLAGELCEGLHMPDAFAFTEWLTVEREALRRLRRTVLAGLVEQLPAEEALCWARRRLGFDPLDATAHADVVRLLGVLGRTSDALAQHASGQRHLDRELGVTRAPAMEAARVGLRFPSWAAAS